MEYDELLTKYIGQFGLYQRLIFFIICLTAIPAAFNIMSTVFIVGVPDHWCAISELDRLDIPIDVRLNVSIPMEEVDDEMVYSSCRMYDRDYTNWTVSTVEELLLNPRNDSRVIDCNNGWVYDQSLHTSAVSDFDMVCDKKVLQATSASIYMAGMMVGVIGSGFLSDQIGRKLTMSIAIVLMVVLNVAIAFINNVTGFLVLRFFLSMVTISQYTCAFVMGIELVGPSWRVHTGTILQYYWAFGYMILAGIAYGIKEWRHLQLALSLPFVLLFSFFFIPESPRWLYMTHKQKRAEKVVQIMAKMNKKQLPEKIEITVKQTKKAFVWDIMRTPRMRLRSFNIFFNWFVNSFVYYGLSLNTSNLGGNVYINFFISGAVEIPAYIFTQIVPSIIGRRISLAGTLILAGVALLLTLAVPDDLNTIAIVMAMIGKFAISASFAIVYIYTAELYPTPVRNVCVGSGSFFARVGGILAPYVGQLSDYGKFIPLTLFGIVSILAGLLSLFFPETKGKFLPETMEDGENLGKKGYVHSSMKPTTNDGKEAGNLNNGFSNTAFEAIESEKGTKPNADNKSECTKF